MLAFGWVACSARTILSVAPASSAVDAGWIQSLSQHRRDTHLASTSVKFDFKQPVRRRLPPVQAQHATQASATQTVEDMLGALETACQLDPRCHNTASAQQTSPPSAQDQSQGEAQATAVQLAKETLMAMGYNMPMRSIERDRFIQEGGLDLVIQLLHHPELQYFAMSALVALLGSPGSTASEDVERVSATLDSVRRGGLLKSLLLLLRPGNSWVIQGRCCGVLTHLLKLEQRVQRGRPVGSTAAVQQGLHWQLLAAGAVDPLAALLAHSNPEVSNQAGTTISVLTSFEDSFRCALLLETDVLHSLVAYLGSSHSHDAFHMASALVTLGGTQGSRCQQEILEAGTVDTLMQMQSIAYCGAFRQPAAALLRQLTSAHPLARRQALATSVKQPPGTSPAEWALWWTALQRDLRLGPDSKSHPLGDAMQGKSSAGASL